MYLTIIFLPFISALVSSFSARSIGSSGVKFLSCFFIFFTAILATISFIEVGLFESPLSIVLFNWLDLESIQLSWSFQLDSLTVSMLLINKGSNELYNCSSIKQSPFDFKLFYDKYTEYYPGLKPPRIEFLEWFIGFSEGEGCFTVQKRGNLTFVITQSSVDVQVLNYIKNNLGFGNISVASVKGKTHRYVVQVHTNITLLCLLFNGNMVLPTRSARFTTFLSSFNEKQLKKNLTPINPITSNVLPSLNDCWLLGFVDGEGCFSVSLLSSSARFRIYFIITQKWEANKFVLEHILSLFNCNGSVLVRKDSDYWDLKIGGLSNCNNLFPYFDKFRLKSKKNYSYLRWKHIHSRLSVGDHLINNTRKQLIVFSEQINKFN